MRNLGRPRSIRSQTEVSSFSRNPIETYEDEQFGYKAANEAFVLIKDKSWSARLQNYAAQLPALQRGIPVDDQYKMEKPGSDADLNAHEVVYVAGQANVGGKTIAINLPNDEEVQLKKGTRRLQLKNAVRAKFDRVLLPIARELIVDDQLPRVTFDAFFANVMFHAVAHGLGRQDPVLFRMRTHPTLAPGIEPTRRHGEALTQPRHAELRAMRVDAGERLALRAEQNRMTLFRSSCSSCNSAYRRSSAVATVLTCMPGC